VLGACIALSLFVSSCTCVSCQRMEVGCGTSQHGSRKTRRGPVHADERKAHIRSIPGSSGVRAREGREVVARVHWPRYSVMYLIRFGLCS
jgi:hypothetical protein